MLKQSCLFVLILFLFFLYNKIYNNKIEKFFNQDNPFLCNHYKFKSDEEYEKRLIEYNKDGGYMKGKLNDKINIKWTKKSNLIENTKITKYVNQLEKHILKPLKKINKDYYFISVVVMFKYEDDYIEEWIHYYILHGVEHFFMYSNDNTIKTKHILQPFINKGYVTLIEWNNNKINMIKKKDRRKFWNNYSKISVQNLAFMDFVKNYKQKTKWIIKVDIDEFIYPINTKLKIKDILHNSSEKYYSVPRIDFGNNNHKKKQKGLIIANYTRSESNPSNTKAIALTKFISNKEDTIGGAHNFKMI